MKNKTSFKNGLLRLYSLYPLRHVMLLSGCLVIALHLLLRGNRQLMSVLSDNFVRPLHKSLSSFNSIFSFSAAEVLIYVSAAALIGFLLVSLLRLRHSRHIGESVYRLILTPLSFAAAVYALFCLMWGTYYYGEDFISRSGLKNDPVSVSELTQVTAYFADMANEYSSLILRNEKGEAQFDREKLLESSSEVFKRLELLYPCLEAPDVEAKGFFFSEILSYLDFTGFFFPFTAEANVNTHFPAALFPATVAHELSHQRGVATEQEANFVAVLASLEYGEPEYVYSASLSAYIYLSNALYDADYDAWEKIFLSLVEGAITDLRCSGEYWQQYETPVQQISNTVYEGFLYSYDQELGLKSYGDCVDLLVNYYIDK